MALKSQGVGQSVATLKASVASAEQQPPLFDALRDCENSSEALNGVLAALAERLGPLMIPQANDGANSVGNVGEAASPITNRLKELNERLVAQNLLVESVLSRLFQ